MLAFAAVGDAQDSEPERFIVVTIADGEIEGRLKSLGDVVEVTTDGGESQRLPRSDVVSIRAADPTAYADDPDALVLLVNGDVLAGMTVSAGEDTLMLNWTGTEPPTPLNVPLEFVRSIVLSQPKEPIERHRLQRMWGLNRPDCDRLILVNGTYADGEIDAVDDASVLLSTTLGSVKTARAEIAAVMMSADLAAEPSLPTEYAVLLCNDGSRITLEDVHVDAAEGITGQMVGGAVVQLPLDRMTYLQLFGERVVSLADRAPAEFVFTPYLIERHPLVVHRNVHGGPLRLRGACSATGLGIHSKSDVTYDLTDDDFRSFAATIGIDDMADGQGHAVFTVLVDGQKVFDSGGVTGSDESRTVGPIDIAGAKQITLSVDYGARGNIRDIADWCNPLLIK